MKLTKTQLKYLRNLAHKLKPVVWLGQQGLTDNVLAEIEAALLHHELIKIKLRLDDRELRDSIIDDICKRTRSENIQKIGNILSIYRRNNKEPVITLSK